MNPVRSSGVAVFEPQYSPHPAPAPAPVREPVSLNERLKQLAEEFPGVLIWWGEATREWWALIGTTGYEAQTLDELLVQIRGALAEIRSQASAPAASLSQRLQNGAAGPHHTRRPHSAYRPTTPPQPPARYADQVTTRRPSRGRRAVDNVRRFLIAESEGSEVW